MLSEPAMLCHPLLALTPLMLLCHYLHTYTHASSPSIGFDSLCENSASKSPLKVELHAAIFCHNAGVLLVWDVAAIAAAAAATANH